MSGWKEVAINGELYRIRPAIQATDQSLLTEMDVLNSWFGMNTQLHIGDNTGSFYHSRVGVVIDPDAISSDAKSAGLASGQDWTVTVFVLGHEQTHAYHREKGKSGRPKKTREAHCDYLGAFYVGLRLTKGGLWPDSVRDVAFQIGTPISSTHPTPEVRRECAIKGMQTMASQLLLFMQEKKLGLDSAAFVQDIQKHIDEESWSIVVEIVRRGGAAGMIDSRVISRAPY